LSALRRNLTAALLVGFTLLSSALFARARSTADPVFSQIEAVVQSLSDITGLSEKHSVPYGRMDKRHLRQFLAKRIKKTIRPEEIKADELTLKMFGFVPQDYDLGKSTTKLLIEQAAAFYDYDAKRLFLVEESPISTQITTLAHELSHALADQHFNLEKFLDDKPTSDDENLAHSAVVEGQACWLMLAYNLKQSGRPAEPTAEMLRGVIDSDEAPTDDYPELSEAPLYIKESLLFPYTHGTAFFQAVHKRLDKKAFAAVFQDPPAASSQILHPERYFAHELPTHPALPQVNGLSQDGEISDGTVGEFDHLLLIRQYIGRSAAAELTPHLRGGQFKIDTGAKSQQPVLRYASEWDSPDAAGRFFKLYLRILTGKWDHSKIVQSGATTMAGTGDSGLFVTRLNGTTVTSVEGLTDSAEWMRLRQDENPAPTVH
jgi:hypothetical protein